MKFTQRTSIIACAAFSIVFVGAQLSLKTMESQNKKTQQKMPPHELMRKRFGWSASRYIEARVKKVEQFIRKLHN